MADVIFHFDPACPWTWRASRWLAAVAENRDLAIEWRAFSLGVLNEGREIPERFRIGMIGSTRVLRLVEALHEEGRGADVARLYTEIGIRTHEAGEQLTSEVIDKSLQAAGLADEAATLDDPQWDGAVRAAHEAAMDAAGPDIGSPVLILQGDRRGLHGPILAQIPDPGEGLVIWDSLIPLLHSPIFYEIKRGRR